MVGNFPQWEKKSLPLHGSFSTAAPVLYAGIHLPLFSQCTVKKIYRIPVFFFTKPFRNGKTPHVDNGFFGPLQRRNYFSFEEGKVFLFLQG
jgi:hypothetical protein